MVIVLKFGGSSITEKGFRTMVKQIVQNTMSSNDKVIIVLSAYYGTTNLLVKLINTRNIEYLNEIIDMHHNFMSELKLDKNIVKNIFENLLLKFDDNSIISNSFILGCGEYLSTRIFHEYLKSININSYLADTSKYIRSIKSSVEIKDLYMSGEIICDGDYIREKLKDNSVIITPGFVISSKDKKRFVMSRGGSDTTASIIASSIKAKKLEIWTDVDGIYTAHPKIISNSKILKKIDYVICQEMAAMGAQVVHPYCIKPCQEKSIPIFIKNTYSTNQTNTVICNNIANYDDLSLIIQNNNFVFKISSLSMWNGYGFVSDIFKIFAIYGVDINIINTSQFEVLVTTSSLSDKTTEGLTYDLKKSYNAKIYKNCDIISIIGFDILKNSKLSVISEFAKNNDSSILITHYSSNKMCISYVINSNKQKQTSENTSIEFYKNLYQLIFDDNIDKLSVRNNLDLNDRITLKKAQKMDKSIFNKWWYKRKEDI